MRNLTVKEIYDMVLMKGYHFMHSVYGVIYSDGSFRVVYGDWDLGKTLRDKGLDVWELVPDENLDLFPVCFLR